MKNILVIGSMNFDLTIHTPRQPVMGETITGEGFYATPGGKGANQAVACARLGENVKMLGCVGTDIYGKQLKENLRREGVDGVIAEVEGTSGIAVIMVCGGDNCIILEEGANARVSESFIKQHTDLFDWADILLLQFEIPIQTVLQAAKTAKERGVKVFINPAPMKEFPDELFKYTDVFVPNRTEAESLLGCPINTIEDAVGAAKTLLNKGPGQVVITLGEQGCVFNRGDEILTRGIYKVKVVDTTAAGDSFIAGLAAKADGDIADAVRYASAVSALTVTKHGAQASLPTRAEVEDFVGKKDFS